MEGLGVANSGFAVREPEAVLPQALAGDLLGETPSVLVEGVLADIEALRYREHYEAVNASGR